MSGRRRYLLADEISAVKWPEGATQIAERFAACPEASDYSDEEAEDFMAVAQYLDDCNQEAVVRTLQAARIPFPPELTFDPYRLGRYVVRRWRDPTVRDSFLNDGVTMDYRWLAALERTRDPGPILRALDSEQSPVLWAFIRRAGLGDMLPVLEAEFGPGQAAKHRTLLQLAKLTMHRYVTERDPPQQPSRWEQRKLARRIRLRDIQLHSMRRSLHKLRHERGLLLDRLGEIGLGDQPEMDHLAAELETIQGEQRAAVQRHAAAMAEQSARYRAVIEQLQAELAAALQDYRETRRLRATWVPAKGGESDASGVALRAPPGRPRDLGNDA